MEEPRTEAPVQREVQKEKARAVRIIQFQRRQCLCQIWKKYLHHSENPALPAAGFMIRAL